MEFLQSIWNINVGVKAIFHEIISSYCLESFPEFMETFPEQMKPFNAILKKRKNYSHYFWCSFWKTFWTGKNFPARDHHETVMRQSWDSHETVYSSTPVAGFADMSVLVCSARWLVNEWRSNRVAAWPWPSAYDEGHGKKVQTKVDCFKLKSQYFEELFYGLKVLHMGGI